MAGKQSEAKIKFTADTNELNQNIKASESQMGRLRSELKLNSEEIKTSGVSVENLSKEHTLLEQTLTASQNKTEALSKKLEIAKQIFGEDSEEAEKWQSKLNNALVTQERLKRAVDGCTEKIEEQKRIEAEAETGYSKLSTEISEQETELQALKRAYTNQIIEQGEAGEEAKELKSRMEKLSAELNQNKQTLSEAENAAEQAAQSYGELGKSASEAGEKAEKSADGYTVAKDVFAGFVSNAIQKGIDKFKELGIEAESAMDKMQAKVGASEQEMSKYKDVITEVYNEGLGESIEDCTESLGTVIQMTDNLNEKDLKNATENVQFLSDVYDMDYAESMRAVNSLTDQFGISQAEAFNLIVQGAQEGLNQNEDLLDVINEYSVQFKSGGLSANDMFNMLKNGADEGVWSIDKMGDSYKEFIIRVSDGTANEYLDALGLDAKEVVEKFRKGGPEAKEAMNQIADSIQNCDDKTTAYKSGAGIMGTMWEDIGQDACLALLNTEGEIDAANDKLSEAKTDAYDNVDTSLKSVGRTLLNEISTPLSDTVGPIIQSVLQFTLEHINVIAPVILGIATSLGILAVALGISSLISGVTKAFSLLNATMKANPIVMIVAVIAGLVVAFTLLWNRCEGFRNFWTSVWNSITKTFNSCASKLKKGIGEIGDKIASLKNGAQTNLSALKNVTGEKLGAIKSIYDKNGGGIKGTVAVMWTGIKGSFNTGYNALNTLTGGKLDDLKNSASKKLDSYKDKFQACKEKILKIFDFKIKIPDIKMPTVTVTWKTEGKLAEAAQFLKLPGLPKFDIAWHAKGAIFTKPTIFGYENGLFHGAGEAGAEAVLPISLMQKYIDNSMMKFIASVPSIDYDLLGDKVAKACSQNESVVVLDNREIARMNWNHKR